MRTGIAISGSGHAALLVWAAVAGILTPSASDAPSVQTTEVSLVTEADLAARTMDQPAAGTEVAVAAPPAEDARARPAVRTDPALSDRDAARLGQADADPAPEALPAPETGADAQTDVAEIATPGIEASGARLIIPPAPNQADRQTPRSPSGAAPIPTPGVAAAPRVDTEAAPKPEDGVRRDREDRTATTDEVSPTPVETETEDTARAAAATEIVTEAKEGRGDAAPATSIRPRQRPTRVARGDDAAPTDTASAIAAALAQAQEEARASAKVPDATEPPGPPLTGGEKDNLRVAVQKCWNLGALSSDAQRVTVEVAVSLDRDGKPQMATIRMIGYRDGGEAAARQAYEAARRAIVRCGAAGFDLPAEKYAQWRDIEMTFNPKNMRVK